MPIALQAMTKAAVAAGVITDDLTKKYGSQQAVLEKLMADGKLYSKDVLPFFGREIEKVVSSGLDEALKSNMNAMGRLQNVFENMQNTIFQSGFGENLTELFNTTATFIKENSNLWKALGEIAGGVFKILTLAIKAATPVLSAVGTILKSITDILGDMSGVIIAAFSPLTYTILPKVLKHFGGIKAVLRGIMGFALRLLLPFLLILGVLEEISEFFNPTGKKTLLNNNINQWKDNSIEMSKKMVEAQKNGISPYTVGGYDLTSKHKVYNPYTQPAPQPPMQFSADVTLDGDKVGEAVIKSQPVQEGIRRQVDEATYNNY